MVSSVLKYGIGYPVPARMNQTRVIYLTPANGSEISTSLAPDENGARHVVFCRVIMGNIELVPAGSNQFHPSCVEFDGGADDLQNPKHYIVWNMNMNSHICPEYVITYKLSSDVEGPPPVSDSSGVSSSSQEEPVVMDPISEQTPNGPVMPFSVLFNAITDKVSSDRMDLVMANYELFSNKEIDRDEFIKKLRLIVGAALLKSAIAGIRSKVWNFGPYKIFRSKVWNFGPYKILCETEFFLHVFKFLIFDAYDWPDFICTKPPPCRGK